MESKGREKTKNGGRYMEYPNAWLVITPEGDCIINYTEPYQQFIFKNEMNPTLAIAEKQYALVKKYFELEKFLKTFKL